MKYAKYHAIGNDYIVIRPSDTQKELDTETIRAICHRNYGVGSDGILFGPLGSKECDFRLRILNPDGSEAETSVNGIRIFARFLWDQQMVGNQCFTIETLGGAVSCEVSGNGKSVTIFMGEVRFESSKVPVDEENREMMCEEVEIDGQTLRFCSAPNCSPHCYVLPEKLRVEEVHHFGPLLVVDSDFPNRTNVQFMKIIDRNNVQLEILEQGAGYTPASIRSATAAAAVACKQGLCDSDITVQMPCGDIQIQFNNGVFATMTGPVKKVSEGLLAMELFE